MSQTRSGLTIQSGDLTIDAVTQAIVDGIRADHKIVAVGQVQDALGVYTRFDFPRGGSDIDFVYIIDDDAVVSVFSKTNFNVTIANPGGSPGLYNGKVAVLGTLWDSTLSLNEPFVRTERGDIDFGQRFHTVRTEVRHVNSGAYDVKYTPRPGATENTHQFSPAAPETGTFRAYTSGPPESLNARVVSRNKDRVQIVGYTQHGMAGEG